MIELGIVLLVAVAAIAYVAWPLLAAESSPASLHTEAPSLETPQENRQEQEETLADLEYDYRSGKLAAADYEDLSKRLRAKLGI